MVDHGQKPWLTMVKKLTMVDHGQKPWSLTIVNHARFNKNVKPWLVIAESIVGYGSTTMVLRAWLIVIGHC